MSSDNYHGNTSNNGYADETYDSSCCDPDDRHNVDRSSEFDGTHYGQPGNCRFAASRLANFDEERNERMRGGCESCGGSASGKRETQGRGCGCSSSKCVGNCRGGCGSRSGEEDDCSQDAHEYREDPSSNEMSGHDSPYGNQSACCSPAGSRPTCKKPTRSCRPPCTSEPQGCGGGGCCGSGCRGGCGKPGRLCMPLRPCSTPPCKPPRGCRPPGSPCAPPRSNTLTPPCCKPQRIPVKKSCGAGGTSNHGSCASSNYDAGDGSNREADETPNYGSSNHHGSANGGCASYGSANYYGSANGGSASYGSANGGGASYGCANGGSTNGGSASYDAPSFRNYETDGNCCCGAAVSENYAAESNSSYVADGNCSCGASTGTNGGFGSNSNRGAGSNSSCGAGGSSSCGGSGSPRGRTKSPQRGGSGGGGGGGCCSSSPPQDDSGYGASGPKLPSGCECLGGGLDCQRCGRKVYQAEMQIASGVPYHNICFSCFCCRKPLEPLTYQENCGEIYCKQCYVRNFGPQGYGYGAGAGALQTPL